MNRLMATSNGSRFIAVQRQTPLLLTNGVVTRANPFLLLFFFFFSTPGQKPLCHRQTIIRDTYIEYSCLQSRPSPGSRSSAKLKTVRGSRLKCIESPLIGFLYRAGAKKNSRSRFGPWRIVGDNLERAVGKLRENYSR